MPGLNAYLQDLRVYIKVKSLSHVTATWLLNTTTAGKLVIFQKVKETLDKLDKDLDERRPAQDPPQSAPEGLVRRQPAQDQPQ